MQRQVISEAVAGAHLFERTTDIDLSGVVVPRRDPMAPPELPADAPVLDVAHPLEIGARPVLRDETDGAVLDGLDRRRGERRDAHIPLVREVGLDDRPGAVATRHHELVRVDALEQARGLEFGHDKLARLEAIETAEALGHLVVHACVGREDVDAGQSVALTDLVVVEIVGRRDLHAARAELRVHVVVGDDRYLAFSERQPQRLADERGIAFVTGVDGDRDIAQHRLGPCGGDDEVTAAVGERIAQVPERTVFFGVEHFEIGDRGLQDGVPVDEALAAVDQALFMQAYEHLGDGAREALVHRETVARPIDRGAEPAHLASDGATGLAFPLPNPLDECLATETCAGQAFALEPPLHDHLRGDAGMVGPWLPKRRIAAHAAVAGERVHDGVLERMPHVQRARDVRRRDDDAIARAVALRREEAGGLPLRVEALLDVGRRVDLVHGR